jgi:hypothetical protein
MFHPNLLNFAPIWQFSKSAGSAIDHSHTKRTDRAHTKRTDRAHTKRTDRAHTER